MSKASDFRWPLLFYIMKNHWLNKKFYKLAERVINKIGIQCNMQYDSTEKAECLAHMVNIANENYNSGQIIIGQKMAFYLLTRHALCQRKKSKSFSWKM
jgi:hypothetical protein